MPGEIDSPSLFIDKHGTKESSFHHPFESFHHLRPLRIENGIEHRMADTPIGQDHVVAENAFFHSADSLDGFLRALVAQIGLQLHADATQRFKGVTEQ